MTEIEIYRDRQNKWRWRMLDDDKTILAHSPRGYDDKSACLDFVEKVMKSTREADSRDLG